MGTFDFMGKKPVVILRPKLLYYILQVLQGIIIKIREHLRIRVGFSLTESQRII